jgi:hypothetical protein
MSRSVVVYGMGAMWSSRTDVALFRGQDQVAVLTYQDEQQDTSSHQFSTTTRSEYPASYYHTCLSGYGYHVQQANFRISKFLQLTAVHSRSDRTRHGQGKNSTRSQRNEVLSTMKDEEETVTAEALAYASAHAHAMQA